MLPSLIPVAVRPEAVVLRDAASLAELARVPLGETAERRWKAPYLTVHRADLQSALLAKAHSHPDIDMTMAADVYDVAVHAHGVTVAIDTADGVVEAPGLLLVGADGVWSTIRRLAGNPGKSRFSGQIAWRRTVRTDSEAGEALTAMGARGVVTAFLHRGFHMVVYPLRAGTAYNLVAFTQGSILPETWSEVMEPPRLAKAMAGTAPQLLGLAEDGEPWTAWPVHTADPKPPWVTADSIALIGDAAHAMTPFAAQGAAMAIEDAETLAASVAVGRADLATSLGAWQRNRRKRVARVAKRGAINRFAWHAYGPAAFARNLFLSLRSGDRLAADLDWLYGWEPPKA